MTLTHWLVGTAGLGLGLFLGYFLAVFTQALPLQDQIVKMKKAGFVPHFSVQNESEYDPSEEIREY